MSKHNISWLRNRFCKRGTQTLGTPLSVSFAIDCQLKQLLNLLFPLLLPLVEKWRTRITSIGKIKTKVQVSHLTHFHRIQRLILEQDWNGIFQKSVHANPLNLLSLCHRFDYELWTSGQWIGPCCAQQGCTTYTKVKERVWLMTWTREQQCRRKYSLEGSTVTAHILFLSFWASQQPCGFYF